MIFLLNARKLGYSETRKPKKKPRKKGFISPIKKQTSLKFVKFYTFWILFLKIEVVQQLPVLGAVYLTTCHFI